MTAMYKEAARAWKKNIGAMSEAARQRLVDSGVLNYRKEIDGLNKGSEGIVAALNKKHPGNVEIIRDNKEVVKRLKKATGIASAEQLQDAGINPKSLKGRLSTMASKIMSKKTHSLNRNFTMFPAQTSDDIVIGLGDVRTNPGKIPKSLKMLGISDPLEGMTAGLNDDSIDYINAIFNRHEVDEARNIVNRKLGPKARPAYRSHISPDVVVRESANVAPAPKEVSDTMKKLRQETGERVDFDFYGGPDYGVSGVYDRRAAKKLHNDFI